MKVIYSDIHVAHQPGMEYNSGQLIAIPEVPSRINAIYSALEDRDNIEIIDCQSFDDEFILEVHSEDYYEFLLTPQDDLITNTPFVFPKPGLNSFKSRNPLVNLGRYFFDTGTPVLEKSFPAIRAAVDCSLTGAKLVRHGENSCYVLTRPPGHHAASNYGGGYCYLNNAAIAAKFLSKSGPVTVLDIDFHHGNGTQEIFYSSSRVQYISLHGSPKWAFPYYSGYKDEIGIGEGEGFNINYPLIEGTGTVNYLKILRKAMKDISEYSPKYIVLSTGYDTALDDPVGFFNLNHDDYIQIGEVISRSGIPVLIIQEGGYNGPANAECAANIIEGLTR
ncbi:MAG: histone deacetylase family protein [Candidatus Hodarchaeales archaeon]